MQFTKTIFDLHKIIKQLTIPISNQQNQKKINVCESVQICTTKPNLDVLDNDNKISIISIKEKKKTKKIDNGINSTNKKNNRRESISKRQYSNNSRDKYNNKNNLEDTFHKLSNGLKNERSANNVFLANASFSSKNSEKLNFNIPIRPKHNNFRYCFSPSKIGEKQKKPKIDIFFNNGINTNSFINSRKRSISNPQNLSHSNSSNKINTSSIGNRKNSNKKDNLFLMNLIPKK